jgi:hypothetical protein
MPSQGVAEGAVRCYYTRSICSSAAKSPILLVEMMTLPSKDGSILFELDFASSFRSYWEGWAIYGSRQRRAP